MPSYEYTGCPMAFARGDGSTEQWVKGDVTSPADAYADRLLDRGLLIANGCIPTQLSFVPTVLSTVAKPNVLLRALVETTNPSVNGGLPVQQVINLSVTGTSKTAEEIATELFLLSGFDLMRQQNMDELMDYTPKLNIGDTLAQGTAIVLIGYADDYQVAPVDQGDFEVQPTVTNLTLMLIPTNELAADEMDFTAAQWSAAQTVHSCVAVVSLGE